uniref:Suprabasin n=1 Tax=Parastrongyloides trichosuri TaxID=131310 RepID=A0A0N4Z5C2_PARTI
MKRRKRKKKLCGLNVISKRDTETVSDHAGKALDEAGKALGGFASSVKDATANTLNEAGETISGAASSVVDGTKNVANKVGETVSNAASSVKDGVVTGGEKVIEGAKGLGDSAVSGLNKAGEAITGAATSVKDTVVSGGEKVIEGAKEFGASAGESLSETAGSVVDGTKNVAGKVGETITGAASSLKEGVVTGGEKVFEGAKGLGASAGETISETAGSVVDGTKNLASGAVEGVGKGLGSIGGVFNDASDKLEAAAGSIAHDGKMSSIPPGEVKCYICNSNYKDQGDCVNSDENVLQKYIKKCKKLTEGSVKGEDAVACRKVRQKVGDEEEIISRECAYSLDDMGTKRRTGSIGVILYTTTCISEDNNKPCNSSSRLYFFAFLPALIYLITYFFN